MHKRIVVTRSEVMHFVDHWPCCQLPREETIFEFDSRGNLVDYTVNAGEWDEESDRALLAMSQDAQAGKIGHVL